MISNTTKITLLLLVVFMFMCLGTSKKNKKQNKKQNKNKKGFIEEWINNNPHKATQLLS